VAVLTTREPTTRLPRPAARRTPSRTRELAFAGLIALYAVLTIGVLVYPSPVLSVDQWWLDLHMWGNHPEYHWFVYHYVMLGQRGPVTAVFLPIFAWLAWRRRTSQPLVLLGTSLLLLNLSVGVVKYAVGRIGPRDSDDVHQVFTSGTLFPSGHVSNTVVMYGVLAMLIPRFRKWIVAAVVFLCLTIGIGTIYLRTHWFSDVVGGWIAGGLVLLLLPSVMPYAQRWTDRAIGHYRRRRRLRRAARTRSEVVVPHRPPTPEPARTPVGAGVAHRRGERAQLPATGQVTPVI
jgi:membrane-associated phospholipid phosphatase